MPSDTFAAYQHLQSRLGREPSLEELYRFLSTPPSGRLLEANQGGSPHAVGSADDARVTAHLRQYELMAMAPDIQRVREQMLRMLLYGPCAGGPGLRLPEPPQAGQRPGHPFPFPQPTP